MHGRFRQAARSIPLVRLLYHWFRALPAGLRGALGRLRRPVLSTTLFVVYFILITPLGFATRILLRKDLSRPHPDTRGWQPINQSSSDKRVYFADPLTPAAVRQTSRCADSMDILMTAPHLASPRLWLDILRSGQLQTALVYLALLPLGALAERPEETQLYSDMYVMF